MLKMTAKLKPPSHKRSLICPRSVAGASDFPPSRPCSSLSSTAGAKLSAVPWRTFPTAVHSYIAIRYCDRSTAVGSQVEVLLEFPPQARGNSILVWCTCGTRVEGWQVRHRSRLSARPSPPDHAGHRPGIFEAHLFGRAASCGARQSGKVPLTAR